MWEEKFETPFYKILTEEKDNNKYIVGNRDFPNWLQRYIDKDTIEYIENCGGITDCLTVNLKNNHCKHMGPLYLYEEDSIIKLSDTKLKFIIHKWNGNETWIINF